MKEFHQAEWKDKLIVADKFKDSRFNYFAKRLIYEENPQILPQDMYNEIHRAIAKQILSTNDEKWNTIPKAYSELDTLRVKYEEEKDEERLAMMNDLNIFLEEIENKYQDA
jgi:exodeoxyribonuclease-1